MGKIIVRMIDMPMTVITLTKAPPSLRGDLTKWMQEISVGVYIGNFNSKIREQLWNRVKENVGDGQATLSYYHRNELGYQFDTHNTNRRSINYDGIQLVQYPQKVEENKEEITKGFSKYAKIRKAKRYSKGRKEQVSNGKSYIILDIETDGLDDKIDNIIEIAAIKVTGKELDRIEYLINSSNRIPENIQKLTGITEEILEKEGVPLEDAIKELSIFIDNFLIIGYNTSFDMNFINSALTNMGEETIKNKTIDVMRYVKKENMFLDNYRLDTVCKHYNIEQKDWHRAMKDVEVTFELIHKVNGFLEYLKNNL
ncbi:MAG: type I-E CRISPR-associated endoribonuclease Cas2e [Gallicola sp.]|nr:type I-E CRISPR-associated endoribonuclease Cas2e [Gallicola sp.]